MLAEEALHARLELADSKGDSAIKLAAKFARQESETARKARIARRRIRGDRVEAVRQMLGIKATGESAPGVRARSARKPKQE